MTQETADDFISVLEYICPRALDSPGQTVAAKIAHCMEYEQDPNIFQCLWVLLQLDLGRTLELYDCVSHIKVADADEAQILTSVRNKATHRVEVAKRFCYVY